MAQEIQESYRLEMAELIRQEKDLKAQIATLDQRLAEPLAKLAKAKELFAKAQQALAHTQAAVTPLESDKTLLVGELALIEEKKTEIRREAAIDRGGGRGLRPGTQAFVEQMEELVGDSETLQMQKEVKQADALDALAALKAKMNQP